MSLYHRFLAWLTHRRAAPLEATEHPPDWMRMDTMEARRQEIQSELERLNREADIYLKRLRRTR